MGGVSLEPGKQGTAEAADAHLDQAEGRRPHTHAQFPCGQRTRPPVVAQTAGKLRSDGTGHSGVHCTESAQITLRQAALLTGPAADFLMIFPEDAVFMVSSSSLLIQLFATDQTEDQNAQHGP